MFEVSDRVSIRGDYIGLPSSRSILGTVTKLWPDRFLVIWDELSTRTEFMVEYDHPLEKVC